MSEFDADIDAGIGAGTEGAGSASGLGGEMAAAGDAAGSAQGDEQGQAGPESFIPDSPEGYQLPDSWAHEDVPEGIASQVNALLLGDKEDFKQFCHAVGMTEDQSGKAFDVLGHIMAEHLAKTSMDTTETVDAALAKLAPGDPDKYWQTAKRGAQYLSIGTELDKAGLTGNPLVLQLVHTIGTLTSEDSMRGNSRGARSLPTGEDARTELYKVIQSEGYKKNDPAAMKMAEQLAARVKR